MPILTVNIYGFAMGIIFYTQLQHNVDYVVIQWRYLMMKKKLKGIVSLLLLTTLIMSMLTACATKLNGTYTNDEGLVKQSFTFKEDNKVEVSAFGIDVEGEYLIEDDTITITYSLLNLSYDLEKSFEKKGSSIFIDGTEFVKSE